MVTPVIDLKTISVPPLHTEAVIHILHVDDELGLLKTTKQILETLGPFQVQTAQSVNEALKQLEEIDFDVIVSDYEMPEKTGLDFLRELRENGNNTPLILFTGRGREEIAIKALNLGASRYCNKVGKPQTVYGELSHSIQQVVEKRNAEKALRQKQEMLEAVTQNVGAGLALISKDYRILWANKLLHDIHPTVEGELCYDIFSKRDSVCLGCGVKEILETGKDKVVHEQEVTNPSGQTITLEITATPIRDEKGDIIAVEEISIDITERKRTEKALKEAKNRFETYLNLARVIMVALDANGDITYANKKFCEVFESNEKEIVGKNWFANFIPKRIRSQTETVFRKAVSGEIEPFGQYENSILTKNGEERIVNWRNIALKDETGKIVGTLSSGEDITERKKMEQKLKKSEEKYRKQFEEALDAIFLADAKTGILIDCNRAATELVGKPKSELIGKHQRVLHIGKETEDGFKGGFKFHRNEDPSKVLEEQVITKNGEIKNVAIKATIFEVGNKRIMQGTFRDITKQKMAEEALMESEENYRALINAMNDTTWVIDFDGNFVDVNDAAVNTLGYSREELLSMGPRDLSKDMPEEAIKKLIDSMPADGIQVFEAIHFTKDGKTIPVEISSSLVTYQGKSTILSIARDITDRKKAEAAMNTMVAKLERVIEKLHVVGKGTRHDARNKLSVIANNVYLAKQFLTSDHKSSEYLDAIDSAVGQINGIFDFARIYEMIGLEDRTYINVEKSIEEAVILFSGLGHTKLETDCGGLLVMADSQLRQIFYNLMDNSVKHAQKLTKIRVYYKENKDDLRLIYEDDGVGVPVNEKDLIFKEGYGKGTGYGLYLIHKICETYGWSIKETGTPGKGAQFTITIPKQDKNWKITHQLQ
ncbi:MAG: hypothetical protein CW691_09485 [Candidatus Bathyarchaeum sp.]|nr:MAG: hypothetical protein CW691_09485 [Candidatus Bathyarchaeum sp.]